MFLGVDCLFDCRPGGNLQREASSFDLGARVQLQAQLSSAQWPTRQSVPTACYKQNFAVHRVFIAASSLTKSQDFKVQNPV